VRQFARTNDGHLRRICAHGRYFGMQTKGARLYIFLEYVSGGSVQSVLERFGPLSELVIRR
jgi:hypothetical protein